MGISEKLAQWIGDIRPEVIPKAVLEKAKLCMLDTIGVTIAGREDDVGKVIINYITSLGGKPVCALIGTSIRTSPPLAALANGVMGHALDLDDISYSYLGHPSVSVLPAALAIGEVMDATGIQVLGAYIIGTEVACKVGAMVSPKYYEDGWHSCVISVFGATAAAGKLLRLTEDQMVQALAIGVSLASGVRGNIGTMAKPFQMGRSAENGVVAALLAKKGMTGSPNIFEKKFGFCHTFKVSSEFESFYSKIGKPFDIDVPGFSLKEFPSCSATHPALNAIIRLIREHQIKPGQVESVDCATTPLVVDSLLYPNPQDAVQARFSMQFCLAVALLNGGEVKVTDFRDEKVSDLKTIEMMKKINLRISPELERKGFAPRDGPEAAIVEIILKSGQRHCTRNFFADWRPDNMPSWDIVCKKYMGCTSSVLSGGKMERSIELIQKMERLRTLRDLMTTFIS